MMEYRDICICDSQTIDNFLFLYALAPVCIQQEWEGYVEIINNQREKYGKVFFDPLMPVHQQYNLRTKGHGDTNASELRAMMLVYRLWKNVLSIKLVEFDNGQQSGYDFFVTLKDNFTTTVSVKLGIVNNDHALISKKIQTDLIYDISDMICIVDNYNDSAIFYNNTPEMRRWIQHKMPIDHNDKRRIPYDLDIVKIIPYNNITEISCPQS